MIFLSLGAGVQSSTLALMAALGEVTPMPDCAIFADTKSEPLAVYRWLNWLEGRLPYPVHRVSAGDLVADLSAAVAKGGRISKPPFFVKVPGQADEGLLGRQCTRDYKITPIRRKIRELLGGTSRSLPRGARAVLWKGISMDEAHRMRPSPVNYVEHQYPLVDKRMTRGHCLKWMADRGFPTPPRSACTMCPYHDDAYWAQIKRETPEEFEVVVKFDRLIRRGLPGIDNEVFLHRSLKPLDEVEFEEADRADLFACSSGECGV